MMMFHAENGPGHGRFVMVSSLHQTLLLDKGSIKLSDATMPPKSKKSTTTASRTSRRQRGKEPESDTATVANDGSKSDAEERPECAKQRWTARVESVGVKLSTNLTCWGYIVSVAELVAECSYGDIALEHVLDVLCPYDHEWIKENSLESIQWNLSNQVLSVLKGPNANHRKTMYKTFEKEC